MRFPPAWLWHKATVTTNTTAMTTIAGTIAMSTTVMKPENTAMVTAAATIRIVIATSTAGTAPTTAIFLPGSPNVIACLPGSSVS